MDLRMLGCSVGTFATVCVVLLASGESKAPAKARYFKGNLHTHSLWSDGDDFPEMIADWYKTRGYDFLALTEHNTIANSVRWVDAEKDETRRLAVKKYLARFGHDWVERKQDQGKEQVRLKKLAEVQSKLDEPGKFLMISGEEITHSFQKLPVHMNAINLKEIIRPVDGASVTETMRVNQRQVAEKRKKSGETIVSFLNHPNFVWGVSAKDMAPVDELRFYEVYNGHPGTNQQGDGTRPSVERIWDLVLANRLSFPRGVPLMGLATDDSHNYHVKAMNKPTPGRGWIMVWARELETRQIMEAIDGGDFYSSTGVTLSHVGYKNGVLSLKIEGEVGVSYKTEFIATLKESSEEAIGAVVGSSESLEPAYKISGNEWYVRARVTSNQAHPNPSFKGEVCTAWTQPVLP